jgi:hypothetical protein
MSLSNTHDISKHGLECWPVCAGLIKPHKKEEKKMNKKRINNLWQMDNQNEVGEFSIANDYKQTEYERIFPHRLTCPVKINKNIRTKKNTLFKTQSMANVESR